MHRWASPSIPRSNPVKRLHRILLDSVTTIQSCQKNPRKAGSRFVDVAATTTSITEHCASRRVDNDNLVKNKRQQASPPLSYYCSSTLIASVLLLFPYLYSYCPATIPLLVLLLSCYYSPTCTLTVLLLLSHSYSHCPAIILPLLFSLSS